MPPTSAPTSRSRSGPAGRSRGPRSAPRRRTARGRGRGWVSALTVGLLAFLALGATVLSAAGGVAWSLFPAIETGPEGITGIPEPTPVAWNGRQPRTGVDISYPQCGRTLRDLPNGYVIVGLDGGMPGRANRCFAEQWRFAQRQAGAAVYVNTADNGRGDPLALGRRNARGDLKALRAHDIGPGTPIWLDVELPTAWRGSQARHRAVITEHLRVLAEAGYPVGIYTAPALWEEITGGARVDVPTWVGIGAQSAGRARATCQARVFGGRTPSIVQRIGTGSDGRPLDRNLTCPGVDLTGLVRPTS